ncbi:transcription repressor OFP3-like [Rutidosis leptorrhynchoides]|uniref:transcription repressor OFP3-like n=1 Tax=Rutidosis leptorrhynchoides TaxID=125765 RepID=UPI003A990AB1
MGNHKFKLSDMLPNAWFYKLKDMSKTKTNTKHHKKSSPSSHYSSSKQSHQNNHHFSQPRNSFYYTPRISELHNSTKFPHYDDDPPTKSTKMPKPHRKTIYKPSPKHTISTSQLTESTHTLQDFIHSPTNDTSSFSGSTHSGHATTSWCTTCRVSSSNSDIIIDLNESKKLNNSSYVYNYVSPEIDIIKLTPIVTKPAKPISRNKQTSHSGKKVSQIPARKSVSGGVKIRVNSPKLAVSKRIAQRRNLTESFAIVKSSFDPQKDFKESMMEMIVENNISKSSEGLEDLLACYLSLNSNEYHGVIVKAFEEIWFSLPGL